MTETRSKFSPKFFKTAKTEKTVRPFHYGGHSKKLQLFIRFFDNNRYYEGKYSFQEFMKNSMLVMEHRYPFLPFELRQARCRKWWTQEVQKLKPKETNKTNLSSPVKSLFCAESVSKNRRIPKKSKLLQRRLFEEDDGCFDEQNSDSSVRHMEKIPTDRSRPTSIEFARLGQSAKSTYSYDLSSVTLNNDEQVIWPESPILECSRTTMGKVSSYHASPKNNNNICFSTRAVQLDFADEISEGTTFSSSNEDVAFVGDGSHDSVKPVVTDYSIHQQPRFSQLTTSIEVSDTPADSFQKSQICSSSSNLSKPCSSFYENPSFPGLLPRKPLSLICKNVVPLDFTTENGDE